MDKYAVVAVESGSYTTRSGEEVNFTKIHYFNLKDKYNSSSQKGFVLLTNDIYPNFSMSDFSAVPGIYNLGFRPFRNRQGKMSPRLVSLDFVSPLTIKENKDLFLLLGAKKYNFEVEKGKTMKGIKIFAVDPLSHDDSDNYLGLQIIEGSLNNSKIDSFSQTPAYYDLQLKEIRGRNGVSVYKPIDATFKDNYSFLNSSTPSSVTSIPAIATSPK